MIILTHVALPVIALALALAQLVKIAFLSRTHLDNMAPAALRWQLRIWSLLRRRCAIIALDVRKLHDLNALLGYSTANDLIRDLVSVRLLRKLGRWLDLIGQWGGDEFVIALANADAWPLVVERIQARLIEITAKLTPEQRAAIQERTGGLVDGLHAAISIIPLTRDAYGSAVAAVNATGPLKEGPQTGARSTSGAIGTCVQVLA